MSQYDSPVNRAEPDTLIAQRGEIIWPSSELPDVNVTVSGTITADGTASFEIDVAYSRTQAMVNVAGIIAATADNAVRIIEASRG